MQDPVIILNKVLTIIDYQDNKERFIEEFHKVCLQQAFLEIIDLISEEKKIELKQSLEGKKEQQEIASILQTFVSKEEYSSRLQRVTQEYFKDYLDTILPTISEQKKEELYNYLSIIKSPDFSDTSA